MPAPDELMSQPWDRRPGESAKAFGSFRTFLELGAERSLAKAARAAGRSVGLYKRWSGRWEWVERAGAWDGAQAREADLARQRLRRQLMDRIERDAEQLRRLAMARLGSMVVRDQATGEVSLDPRVTARDAVAVYRLYLELLGMKAQEARPPAGEESEGGYLSELSDEELRAYLALLEKRADSEEGADGDEQR